MPRTRQAVSGYSVSPSGILHAVIITFRGNKVDIMTKCNRDVNPKTWKRIHGKSTHVLFSEFQPCSHCFGK